MVDDNSLVWADFEESFQAAASDARASSLGKGNPAWMNHPVAATDSIAPIPPPGNSMFGSSARIGKAVSMDRWSKQIQIKTTKLSSAYKRASSSSRLDSVKNPAPKSSFSMSLPTTKNDKKRPGPVILVEAPKHEALDHSRTTASTLSSDSETGYDVNRRNSSSRQRSSSRTNEGGRASVNKSETIATPTTPKKSLSTHNRARSRSATRHDREHRDYDRGPDSTTVEGPRRSRSASRSRHTSAQPVLTEIVHNQRTESRERKPTHIIEIAESRSRRRARSSSQPREAQERGRSNSRPPSTHSRQGAATRSTSLTRLPAPASPKKSSRGNRPPPSTYRTLRELRVQASPANRSRSRSRTRTMSSENDFVMEPEHDIRNEHHSDEENLESRDDEAILPKKTGIMEKLFGDQVERPIPSRIFGIHQYEIHPRVLLAATVYHNTATCLWITTINTNQRGVAKNPATANKFLKAFSFGTEREARASAIANAPPKLIPFHESPTCFLCKGKFAVFRRASHCRNCGVCVCNSCSTTWPAKMIPATYNLKNDAQVKICLSCNSLSTLFKKALLSGNYEESVELYATGNINLRTPFNISSKKDELMWPVHCAVEGGNLGLIRWLIDDHFCPTKLCASGNKNRRAETVNSPILTSKGRSVLGIALECRRIETLRYLVVECGVSVYDSKDLKLALGALEAALIALPATTCQVPARLDTTIVARWDQASFDDMSETSSLGADDFNNLEDNWTVGSKSRQSKSSRHSDTCIICCTQTIDCVATPCGHQVCCLDCSTTLSLCPVCNNRGTFIKIFKP